MEYLFLLAEDADLVATDEQRARAVERVRDYARGLAADGVLRGGALLRPGTEARRVRRPRAFNSAAIPRNVQRFARRSRIAVSTACSAASGSRWSPSAERRKP